LGIKANTHFNIFYFMPSQLLQIFAKAPVPGEVKTRLAKDIGDVQEACDVYQLLLLNTIKSTASEGWQAELWCAPDELHPVLQALGTENSIRLEKQCNGDIGERMLFALKAGLNSTKKVVLLGSDCPVISAEYIEQAFKELDTKDVVFGPVEDGGYILIACRSLQVNLFKDVQWSCANTLALNIEAVTRCGLSYGLLERLWDLDELKDLERMLL
jgi:rSAM/selenodomain-associated transferase 1